MLPNSETGRCLEIEITPEIIAAGEEYAVDSMAFVDPVVSGSDLRDFVTSLYRVMASVGKAPTGRSAAS